MLCELWGFPQWLVVTGTIPNSRGSCGIVSFASFAWLFPWLQVVVSHYSSVLSWDIFIPLEFLLCVALFPAVCCPVNSNIWPSWTPSSISSSSETPGLHVDLYVLQHVNSPGSKLVQLWGSSHLFSVSQGLILFFSWYSLLHKFCPVFQLFQERK